MKTMRNPLWLLMLLLALSACHFRGQDLFFEPIAQGDIINYRESNPALLIIADEDEIDALVPDVLAEDPALAAQFRQLDYSCTFAILVLHGYVGSSGFSVTVRQVVRRDSEVIVQAEFVEPTIGTRIYPAFTSPYHLIAVSKVGAWGQQVRFVLMRDDQEVAETTHFVP